MGTKATSYFFRIAQTAISALICLIVLVTTASESFSAPFPIAISGAAQSGAFDGTNYLIGIESHLTSPPTIGAQIISPTGSKIGSFISTERTGIATNVAFDGTNYLLIWEDDALNTLNSGSLGWQIFGQFISKAGTPVGSAFNISGLGVWFDGVKVMTYGGGKYLVTYTRLIDAALGDNSNNRYISGRIVDPNGTMGGEFRISSGYGDASDVAFDGSNFFVIWREDSLDEEIRGCLVSTAGVPGNEISINASPAPSDNPASIAFDGTNYFVVWNDETNGPGTGQWDVFGQFVNPSGSLVGGMFNITNENGPQVVTSVAFDGTDYFAAWMDMSNDANHNGACDSGEGTCWDMYGQYIRPNGTLAGGKTVISTAADNQVGVVGYANGSYLVLQNNGVVMGQGGISQVSDAVGLFVLPTVNSFTASGSYTYTGGVSGGPLTFNFTASDFICEGPDFGAGADTVTALTATTMTWHTPGSADTMIWNRSSGTAGDITGTWISKDSSGSSWILTFNSNGTVAVSGAIRHCGSNGSLGMSTISFSPASGLVGDLVTITDDSFNPGNKSNFSPLLADNTVLFNGVPAVVTDVQANKIFAIVPSGASSGTISVTNAGGASTSGSQFIVNPGAPTATLRWGGVYHRIDSDDSEYDALEIGLSSTVTSLTGMTVTVSGPSGFTYDFSDAELRPYLGRLVAYKRYPTTTPLQPGVYTFTLDDSQGHISHRVDSHVTVVGPLPQVDSNTIQMQRKADGSYRFSWAPLNDNNTYYYRLRISRNDAAETNVYDSTRDMVTYADVPTGILFDDSMYKVKVQVFDSPDNDLATNRSDSAWRLFYPQSGDYDPNRLLTTYAVIYNRTDGTAAQTFEAVLGVSAPDNVTSITLTGPPGFVTYEFVLSGTNPVPDFSLNTTTGINIIKGFYKIFPSQPKTTMPNGLYTFTYIANSVIHTAYATLTSPVTYPVVDSTTMQAQDLGNGNIRFSWANVNHTGALYYRAVVNSQSKALSYSTPQQNQTYVDISSSIINNLAPTRWRVEVYDSDDSTTRRNRFVAPYKTLTLPLPAYDAAKPVINRYRIRNIVTAAGVAYSHISVETAVSQTPFTSITVSGPSAYSRNLMTAGRFSPAYNSYTLEAPGSLVPGLYTITVTNAAGSAVRHMYVPAVQPLPQPDFKTLHNDLEPNGDLRISWAPVVSAVPVWYSFYVYAQADQNGDGLMDQVYVINSLQLSSILIPASTVAGWPVSVMGQVWAHDGSNFSTVNNVSQSRIVGLATPGFNYATLVDGDGDGFVSNADPNDVISTIYPFSAGNDALPTAVTGTNPISGAFEVATSGPFSVTFNKVIDQRTLATGFTLNNGATGTISYNPATRTATFTPSADLMTGVTYTAAVSTALLDQAGHALTAPYSWSFTTAGAAPTLSVTIIGEGNINSNTGTPGIHGTTPGVYSSPYAFNAPVTLTATLRTAGWDFTAWGGDGTCTGSALTCNLSMNAQTKNVTATFTAQQNIKNGANYYGTLTDALLPSAVANNDTLLIKALTFNEGPIIYNVPGVRVKLRGGFTDAGFTLNPSVSTVSGRLTIHTGTLSLEKIKIK